MHGVADAPGLTRVSAFPAAVAWLALAGFIFYGSTAGVTGQRQRIDALPGISLPDIAQNVLLYLPFGALGVWALRRIAPSRTALCLCITAIAVVYSITMELMQLVSASRIASPLDVIANVAGAWTGVMASSPLERAFEIAVERLRPTGLLTAPARYVLVAVLAAIIVSAWYPFDVTLDVSTLSDRTRAVRLDPWLSPGSVELWQQGGRFFVLSSILAWCLPGLRRRAGLVAALAGITAAIVIDVGQLGMGSRPVGGSVLVSQAAGSCAGAAAALFIALARRTWYAAA